MFCGIDVSPKVFERSQESALCIMDWFMHKMMTVNKKLSKQCAKNGRAFVYGDFGGYVIK